MVNWTHGTWKVSFVSSLIVPRIPTFCPQAFQLIKRQSLDPYLHFHSKDEQRSKLKLLALKLLLRRTAGLNIQALLNAHQSFTMQNMDFNIIMCLQNYQELYDNTNALIYSLELKSIYHPFMQLMQVRCLHWRSTIWVGQQTVICLSNFVILQNMTHFLVNEILADISLLLHKTKTKKEMACSCQNHSVPQIVLIRRYKNQIVIQ